jgi:hypothetical protein
MRLEPAPEVVAAAWEAALATDGHAVASRSAPHIGQAYRDAHISVPVAPKWLPVLRAVADAYGLTPPQLARVAVEQALGLPPGSLDAPPRASQAAYEALAALATAAARREYAAHCQRVVDAFSRMTASERRREAWHLSQGRPAHGEEPHWRERTAPNRLAAAAQAEHARAEAATAIRATATELARARHRADEEQEAALRDHRARLAAGGPEHP